MPKDMITEQVDMRSMRGDPNVRSGEMLRRESHLLGLGFSREGIDRLMEGNPTLRDPIVINSQIASLKERGFNDPIRMIVTFSSTLNHSPENIDMKIEGLKERGFANPVKMIESYPSLLGQSLASVDTKLMGLRDRGFEDPVKMIEKYISISGHSLDSMDTKLMCLRDRGFVDPVKMIEKAPSIFGIDFKNLDDKLVGLRDRGFSDPIKLIESYPSIFNFSFENIDRRLGLIGGIASLYKTPFTAAQLMENHNSIFGSKLDKLVVLARVLRKFVNDPQEIVSSVVSKLLFSNIEDVLVAVDLVGPKDEPSISEFIKLVKEVKAAGFSKEEKQKIIEQGLINDSKIKLRYLRGYSKKEEQVPVPGNGKIEE